jgi:hypothetical protein
MIFFRLKSIDLKKIERRLFGEDSSIIAEKLRKKSIYGHFKSWRLVNLIVKTGDNLK